MFLPVTVQELHERGIASPDFVIVSGDAYVDHPSFGHAIIGRLVESQGFSVAMLPQPVCDADYTRFGAPRIAFLVSPGVVDSMVNNYTVARNRREKDVYSEGGEAGKRPDRALTVYTQTLKRLYPDVPVIAGGIEASLRRLSHYDYWSDSVLHSVAYDSGADLLIYGMGEYPILELCKAAARGIPLGGLKNIRGTAYLTKLENAPKAVRQAVAGEKQDAYTVISSHERVATDKKLYCKAFIAAYDNTDPITGKGIIQKQDYDSYVVVNRPAPPLGEKEMDFVYGLHYERKPHPMYTRGVPAIEEVEFSVTAHRGCFGNCSFCALTYHQGRIITPRSEQSILAEVEEIAASPDFKGYIHDIGGPSANFHQPACDKQAEKGACGGRDCIGFSACPNLRVSHEKYLRILRRARSIKGVKKVFVRSGVRYDYVMLDPDKSFFDELVRHHISGQLKVAPEHCCDAVLAAMNKPAFAKYRAFYDEFYRRTKAAGKNQFLVPYFISSHPGCTLNGAIELTLYLKSIGYMPKQVQDFYPTPGTLSTTMYYTELDPRTLQPVYVAKSKEEKALQRALLQYRLPANRPLIEQALIRAGRRDALEAIFGLAAVAGKDTTAQGRGQRSAMQPPRNSENRGGHGKNKKLAKTKKK